MTIEGKCGGGSIAVLDEAVAAERSRYLELLVDSCNQVKEESSGPIGQVLKTRLETYLDHFLPAFVQADMSATGHHRAYCRASSMVFSLGALAVIIVAAQYLFHLPHMLVAGEIVCIGLILGVFHWGNHRRWHRTWVDCRYFAERVRCGLFVSFLCGKSAIRDIPKWSHRVVEGAWCNEEFQKLMKSRPHPGPLTTAQLDVLKHFLITHWLEDQRGYHRSVYETRIHKHHLVSRLGETCFWLTLAAALLHLTPHDWRHALHLDKILTDGVLTFVVIALPALGTAFAGLRGHFEFKKIAIRSQMIAFELESIIDEAGKVEDLAGLTILVLRAEDLMIQENVGWHLHTSEKVIPSEG